jgi:hypothetical protein
MINTMVTAMKTLHRTLSSASWPLLAPAAGQSSAAASEARCQRDAAVCLSRGYESQRNECLSDASTARAIREPATIDPGRNARNALQRCEALKDADRSDCVARMQGHGTTSGSVAGGGIYRELVTREGVAVPAAPASAASQ